MCTASRIDRMSRQRLRCKEQTAPLQLGSFGQDPWVLRPKRLRWLAYAKSLAPAETAAPHDVASAHHTTTHFPTAAMASALAAVGKWVVW